MHNLLVSLGTHQECSMEIQELEAELSYQPGTVIALCGKALKHRVRS